ncbi:MAG: NifB/NifX family molybdenum-iron cluster-binding protein [Eubacteriales bacterium]|nr:NifB/NifX family molybdenum-iron cluster-binding protein [Eubacteriales bacterium]
MKVAISSLGQTLSSEMDPRFGRAELFLIVDTDTLEYSVLDNTAYQATGGAGIAAAQAVIGMKVAAVITGQLGPNALNVLSREGLDLYQGQAKSVQENIELLNQGKLVRIAQSGPSHQGMGGEGHHGGHA